MNPTPDLPELPYGAIGPELNALFAATINKLDREWPSFWRHENGAEYILDSCARITQNTHEVVRYLCADQPAKIERKLEFALAVGPLLRSLVDVLFLLVFMLEDLPERSRWYMRSGWREEAEEYARWRAAYSDDPNWAEWLSEFARGLESAKKGSGITLEEAANPSSIRYWLTPGQMLRSGQIGGKAEAFLQHLNDWYYRQFSSHTHLSLPGLIMRSSGLREASDEEAERIRHWRVDKQRSDAMAITILLSLAVMSEIDAACHFAMRTRLLYVWGILKSYLGMADDLFQLRYEDLLNRAGA